ncbi:MAG TPA: carboxypeptidase-like regulatory domain-containing protein [Caldisericia bacterium]|nr:carboxypeptidase regulatory-like domain-containing protein [Caldisericia bacterium]HOR46329.1 carboxypeptidase-like regulatory domain-containing protein [Caldisericia bacterium]HOU08236.1 carboxypeptidase-like regulatory domain-containing protein [Caldisericia bacterium]HPL89200.1 carboxypeptidase-like regulatory domain-containing protein [Caldisericia bacterium]HQG58868.1 carboxypeptidase-like regulatory domain-containing protein [Caldisericia bacterium]
MTKKLAPITLALVLAIVFFASCEGGSSKLSGTVRDTISLAKIANASIVIDSKTIVTDDDGRFIVEGLSEGKFDVIISADGYSKTTYPEFEIKDGDNFLEATLSKTDDSKAGEITKTPLKPQTTPPPAPGKPVGNRPNINIYMDFTNCVVKTTKGDKQFPGSILEMTFNGDSVRNVIKSQNPQAPQTEIIFTPTTTYNKVPSQGWIGIKVPKGQAPGESSKIQLQLYMKAIKEVLSDKNSTFNALGKGSFASQEVEKYYIAGYGKDATDQVDGEILVLSKGSNKGMMVSFNGKLTIGSEGDSYTIEITNIGSAPKIQIPENAKIMDPSSSTQLKPSQPISKPKNP